ncbi:universal stress protein [Halopiger djelfimassiliensis]|uniref:universal stress protein n=1 Tax=Halopiger djelfimassiliensis TaxID=1293047 RepID=UPI000678239D|nr:universal stress protein [Halopiger djelfimassiliensis]
MGDVQTVIEDDSAPDQQYTLLVAIANPDHVTQLMRTAIDLAGDRDGQIRVVNVVHKPVTSPFILFSEERIKREFTDGQQAVLDEALAVASDSSIPVQRSLLVGTDVSDALLSAVDDTDADALLLGWQERDRPSDVVLGTTVDPLIRRASCDVFVERVGTTADGMDTILLPTDGGPHIEPATDLAGAVARANDATVTVVSYVSPTAGDAERETARDHVALATDRLTDVPVDADVLETDDVADAIVTAGAEHDLITLGATREHRLRSRAVGSVAATVGQRATVPIVIAKRGSSGSLLERALDWWR